MIIVLKKAVKYFVYMFIVIEGGSFILKKGSMNDIWLQSLVLAFFSIMIAFRDYKKVQKKSNNETQ
ncbi:hypothetical protein [Fusibacter bizertensis]